LIAQWSEGRPCSRQPESKKCGKTNIQYSGGKKREGKDTGHAKSGIPEMTREEKASFLVSTVGQSEIVPTRDLAVLAVPSSSAEAILMTRILRGLLHTVGAIRELDFYRTASSMEGRDLVEKTRLDILKQSSRSLEAPQHPTRSSHVHHAELLAK
jgi:hypothetical protein